MFKAFIHTIVVTLAVIFFVSFAPKSTAFAFKAPEKSTVTLSVRSSPQAAFESKLELSSAEMTQALKKARKEKADFPLSQEDIYVTIRQAGRERHFRMEPSGTLWDETSLERIILPKKTAEKLKGYAEGLRKLHYGKMIPWKKVTNILPRKAIFTVTDMETGLTFRVQRRAGSNHADVQPLTKEDTKIMKRIYYNRWSWKRKAILVHSGNEWLAASMNGMPHGRDSIRDNGFSGHFCIHFFGSTTHRSKDPDLTHQLMVHKAAGKVRTFLDSASPRFWRKASLKPCTIRIRKFFRCFPRDLLVKNVIFL